MDSRKAHIVWDIPRLVPLMDVNRTASGACQDGHADADFCQDGGAAYGGHCQVGGAATGDFCQGGGAAIATCLDGGAGV